MNAARIVILLVAMIAAVAAAFLVRTVISKKEAPPPTQVVQAPMTGVLIAAKRIGIGQALKPDDMKWQPWPETNLPANAILQKQRPSALQDTAGLVAFTAFEEGELIMSNRLLVPGKSGFLSGVIQPGMRAISVRISPESAVGGFILPGDRLDVVLVQEGGDTPGGGLSRTIISNVRVLAIDQKVDGTNAGSSMVGKTATLELDPKQSELLALASTRGTLVYLLRGISDVKSVSIRPETLNDFRKPPGRQIKIYRSGAPKVVTVKKGLGSVAAEKDKP